MRIANYRLEKSGNKARVAATVSWEDCDRPTEELYFETDEAFADSLSFNPHAFLVGRITPALHYGEKRVLVDGEVCPELREGLIVAMSTLRQWFGPEKDLPQIEATLKGGMSGFRGPERAGFFYSGGVDSFATLCANRLNYPLDHPRSIKDGLYVYGLGGQAVPEAYELVRGSLTEASLELGITLIPVYTNVYAPFRDEDANDSFNFWLYKFFGSGLAAIAHAFARRFDVVSIASCDDILNLVPYGSHPLLNPRFSSAELQIRHDGITYTRFDKTKLLSGSEAALKHLRVCNNYKLFNAGELNCGTCEKCLRTMLALVALGALERTPAFSCDDVSAEMVQEAVRIRDEVIAPYYREMIPPLAARGRHDLVRVIEVKLEEFSKGQKAKVRKAKVKDFDRKYLGGSMRGFKKMLRP